MQDDVAWSYEVELAGVSEKGQAFELAPDAATRKQLAEVAGVVGIPSLKVSLNVRPIGSDAAEVTGRLEGVVRQMCVVSLEQFDNPIAENISVDFAAAPQSEATSDDEEEVEDLPDPIIDGKIDLGALGTEFLILAIDPYPKKPGVEPFVPVIEEVEPEPSRSPFEQLAGLKNRIKKD